MVSAAGAAVGATSRDSSICGAGAAAFSAAGGGGAATAGTLTGVSWAVGRVWFDCSPCSVVSSTGVLLFFLRPNRERPIFLRASIALGGCL